MIKLTLVQYIKSFTLKTFWETLSRNILTFILFVVISGVLALICDFLHCTFILGEHRWELEQRLYDIINLRSNGQQSAIGLTFNAFLIYHGFFVALIINDKLRDRSRVPLTDTVYIKWYFIGLGILSAGIIVFSDGLRFLYHEYSYGYGLNISYYFITWLSSLIITFFPCLVYYLCYAMLCKSTNTNLKNSPYVFWQVILVGLIASTFIHVVGVFASHALSPLFIILGFGNNILVLIVVAFVGLWLASAATLINGELIQLAVVKSSKSIAFKKIDHPDLLD